ncbi:hypothetical protein MSAN_00884800 [Mycena sanguinolenta]|uniref:Uncharacterized protein n=1 Tax=Mycena sanguinolenta TaxID=230812 RepID=A0A8H6YWV7_9AGAR|nr:hypothetical protein MSAN_00884800 [Mycena sanguinolenta]
MNFARLAILSALVATTSVSATKCTLFGNVTLFWGTVEDTPTTAIPLGFGTGPTDAEGNVLLATSEGVPAETFGVFVCGTANPSGGGGGGSGTAGPSTMLSLIGQPGPGFSGNCLTASGLDTSNITISLQSCINGITNTPEASQQWQVTLNGTTLDSLVFLGDQSNSVLPFGSAFNYVPSLVGPDAADGDYVSLDFSPGAVTPSETAEGLLVNFV